MIETEIAADATKDIMEALQYIYSDDDEIVEVLRVLQRDDGVREYITCVIALAILQGQAAYMKPRNITGLTFGSDRAR